MSSARSVTKASVVAEIAASDGLMDAADVMRFLKIGRTLLDALTGKGLLGRPVYLGPKAKRWRREDVIRFAEQGDVEAAPAAMALGGVMNANRAAS